MIRICQQNDVEEIYFIINEAAKAYEGVIPFDCYHQPYMSKDELEREMRRMTFLGWETAEELGGVMGLEPIKDVTLIRHAYVLPEYQNRGIGKKLMSHLKSLTTTPLLLVGMWADAHWAIAFYRKQGFNMMPDKDKLLANYWDISPRQIETSVVMGIETNNN